MKPETKVAIEKLCRDFHLPLGDEYTQDWIYELADEHRTLDRVVQYIGAYTRPDYDSDDKHLIVSLALDILNDLVDSETAARSRVWSALEAIIKSNPQLHRDQVEYWALLGEALDNSFALTPLVRELHKELYSG